MNEKIKRIYMPMSETSFYILYSLQDKRHGYNIGLYVENITNGEVTISPGTMYGSLAKMEKDGLINFIKEEENRKIYQISSLGKTILDKEIKRIKRLYKNIKEEKK